MLVDADVDQGEAPAWRFAELAGLDEQWACEEEAEAGVPRTSKKRKMTCRRCGKTTHTAPTDDSTDISYMPSNLGVLAGRREKLIETKVETAVAKKIVQVSSTLPPAAVAAPAAVTGAVVPAASSSSINPEVPEQCIQTA